MAMDAVILCEFAPGDAGVRADLLGRIAPLALSGEGRLSFVATGREVPGGTAIEIVAIAFAKELAAETALRRWRDDATFPAAASLRLLRIEPIWSIEPLALMFP